MIKSLIMIYKTLVGLGALMKEEEDLNKLSASNPKNKNLQMAYSGYSWTPSHSLTAIKYQRHGFVEKKPFLPGERYVVVSIVQRCIHCKKKVTDFSVPSLDVSYQTLPGQGEFG